MHFLKYISPTKSTALPKFSILISGINTAEKLFMCSTDNFPSDYKFLFISIFIICNKISLFNYYFFLNKTTLGFCMCEFLVLFFTDDLGSCRGHCCFTLDSAGAGKGNQGIS